MLVGSEFAFFLNMNKSVQYIFVCTRSSTELFDVDLENQSHVFQKCTVHIYTSKYGLQSTP